MFRASYMLSVVFWLLLALPPLCLAGALPVVDLLPETVDKGDLASNLKQRFDADVTWVAPPQGLLDSGRWLSSAEARGYCEHLVHELAGDTGSTSADAAFSRLMERADINLLELALDKVLMDVSAAWALLPCRQSILQRADLRRLFLFEAVTHFYLDDGNYEAIFLELLAADPRLYLEPDYPPRVQDAFLEVAKQVSRVEAARLPLSELEGDIFLDGLPLAGDGLVQPGRHVLQLIGPFGDVKTVVWPVATSEAGADPLPIPLGLRDKLTLPTEDYAKKRLMYGLERGGSSDGVPSTEEELSREILVRYLRQAGLDGLLLAYGQPPAVYVYESSGNQMPASPANTLSYLSNESSSDFAYSGRDRSRGGLEKGEPMAGLAMAYLFYQPLGQTTILHPSNLGLSFRGGYEFGAMRGLLRAGVALPNPVRGNAGEAGSCGSYSGDGDATEEDIENAAACLPLRPAADFWLGAGVPISLPRTLVLTPMLFVGAAIIPEVLLAGASSTSLVYRALGVGPQLAVNVSGTIKLGTQNISLWGEPYLGAIFTRLEGTGIVALPLGARLGLGVTF